jgi:hypothetical protein
MSPDDATAPPSALWQQIQADDEARKKIQDAVEVGLAPYLNRLNESFERVTELLSAAEHTSRPTFRSVEFDRSRQAAADDILRAAVVLTHAYLEDFLRTIASVLLPAANESCLDGIPLAGLTTRTDRFSLGKLVQHKEKTVGQVLHESVSEYLNRSTFCSTDDIAQLLCRLGFSVPDHNHDFPEIQRMIERSHQIVHRADRIKPSDSDTYTLQPIEAYEVLTWLKATNDFMSSLCGPVFLKLNPLQELAKKLNITVVPRK